jgi:hypothetical protein
MRWPWNVRVTSVTSAFAAKGYMPKPEYWRVEVKINGEWGLAGHGDSWLEAFLVGVTA